MIIVQDFFAYLIALTSILSMLHFGFFIVGANIYDVMQAKKLQQRRRLTSKRRRLASPMISVIIPAHNEETGVIRTLDSVLMSTYKNIEIIVVNDGSTDKTAAAVQNYIEKMPRTHHATYMARNTRGKGLLRRNIKIEPFSPPVTLLSQTNMGKGAAMNNGIRHAQGKFIMTLDADSLLDTHALENTINHFRDPRVLGVAANVRIMGDDGWLNLLQRFEHMIGYRSKKFYSLTGTEFIVGGVASTYRRSTLKKVGLYDTDTMTEDVGLSLKIIAKEGNRKKRIIYAADVVATTGGVQTFKQLIRQRYRWKMGVLQNLFKFRSLLRGNLYRTHSLGLTAYRLPMAILSELLLIVSPLALLYIIVISISYQTITVLLGAYISITLYILWNVWPDEYLTWQQKLKMSLYATFMYFIFYAMDLVQTLAIIRCLKNFNNVIRLTDKHVTWVSPTRIGEALPSSAS